MLKTATLFNRPEIAEYCISAGARVVYRNPYDLNKTIVTGHSCETFKVLIEHGLDINHPIYFYETYYNVLCKMTILNRFAFAWRTMPVQSVDSYDGHFILAIVATWASTEISELLLAWERG